jgi:hypothetical protein
MGGTRGHKEGQHEPSLGQPAGSGPGRISVREGVEVFETGPDATFAADGPVFVTIWRGLLRADHFERIDGYYNQVLSSHPRLGALVVVEPEDVKLPDASVRKLSSEFIARFQDQLVGVGFVLEGRHVKYTLLRVSLATIALISPMGVPQQAFETVAAGCDWMASKLPGISAPSIAATVAALRRQRL